jgi:hypothetical protein
VNPDPEIRSSGDVQYCADYPTARLTSISGFPTVLSVKCTLKVKVHS